MNLDFAAAIEALNREAPSGDAAFEVANAARPAGDYFFASLLPEVPMTGYTVRSSNMTVRATMAGLVGMDSPYPPGGAVELSSFLEDSAKIGNEVALNEQMLRQIQQLAMTLFMQGQPTNEVAAREALNFLDRIIIQPHLDTAEFLRSQALVEGKIDWTYNKKKLLVDYGVPTANFLTARTGNDGYGGSASKFWADMYLLSARLKGRVRLYALHSETAQMILSNPVNGLVQTGGGVGQGTISFRRWARNSSGAETPGVFSPDARDSVTFVLVDREAEILDPANPGSTIKIPFMTRGKILAIGDVQNDAYVPGQGSVEENLDPKRLGYTHIAPTVEGGGRPGRWAQLYVPQHSPWQLNGRGASNLLPVVERPDGIAVATTDMV